MALQKWSPAQRAYVSSGPRMKFPSEDALYLELARIWADSSLQMSRLCEANGIRYIHFLQPNQYIEDSKTLTQEEKDVAYNPDHPYRPGVIEGYPCLFRAAEELEAQGVSFHDLTRVYVDSEETLYVDDCCHVNARGFEIIAQAMAEKMLQEID